MLSEASAVLVRCMAIGIVAALGFGVGSFHLLLWSGLSGPPASVLSVFAGLAIMITSVVVSAVEYEAADGRANQKAVGDE